MIGDVKNIKWKEVSEMNKINMPGFTAEAWLYKTSEHHQMAQVIPALRSEGALVPQITGGLNPGPQVRGGLNPGPQVRGGLNPGDRWCLCPCCLCVWTGFGIECSCC